MNLSNVSSNDTLVLGSLNQGKDFNIKTDAAFFDILSNSLYSYPLLAVVRETITNAADANHEAHVEEPVEVTVDWKNSTFTISDKGMGIPHEKLHEIYCTYGGTTKQDNDSTGGFGLGCKAPFALVNAFTISNSYQGVKKDYILKKENGIPQLVELDHSTETNQSGLTVNIPLPKSINPVDLISIIKSFIFYSGLNVKLNGELQDKVSYSTCKAYYVPVNKYSINDISLAKIHCYTYGNGVVIRYGCNLFVVNPSDLPEEGKQLELLLNRFSSERYRNTLKALRINGIGLESLRWSFDAILNVAPNTLDITPNRESLRYTPKTIATLTLALEKELHRLTAQTQFNEWLEGYKYNRVYTALDINNLVEAINKNNCISAKDLTKGDSLVMTVFKGIVGNTDNTFNTADKEYSAYIADHLDEVHDLMTKYWEPSVREKPVISDGVKVLYDFEEPMRETLSKHGISRYWFQDLKYSTEALGYKTFTELVHSYGNWYWAYLKRLYKIVVLSKYSSYDREDPLHTQVQKLFPTVVASHLLSSCYRVQLSSFKKALAIKDELENQGYYVINLVPEKSPSTRVRKHGTSTQELIDKLGDKTHAYYVTPEERSKLLVRKSLAGSPLFNCFIHHLYPVDALNKLERLNTYEVLEVKTKNSIAVLERNGIKSMSEILDADVRDLFDKDPNVKLALNLMYYTEYGTSLGHPFSYILWYLFQMQDFCEEFKLPVLNQSQLADVALLSAYQQQNPHFLDSLVEKDETTQRVVGNLQDFMAYNKDFASLVEYIYRLLYQYNSSGVTPPKKIVNLLTSVLKAIFISDVEQTEEETSNE